MCAATTEKIDTTIECIVTSSQIDGETTITIGSATLPKLNWTRLNYKGDDHDNRRVLEHRKRDCQCEVCYRESNRQLP